MSVFDKALNIWNKYRVLRYLFSGGTGFVVNVVILYVMTDVFGIWYVISGAVAFVVSITASFLLHRIVTFNYDKDGTVHGQYSGFFVVSLINLLINEIILVFFVEVLGLWYIIAQTIASIVIAILGYFVYRHVIFREKRDSASTTE